MLRVLAPCLILTLAACAPTIDPAAKASLDGWRAGLASRSTVYAERDAVPPPPAPGQWTEHLQIDGDGAPSRVIRKVLSRESGGLWLEFENQTYEGTSIAKVLLAADNWSDPATMDLRRIIVQQKGEPAQELPVLVGQIGVKGLLASLGAEATSVQGPVETARVPAGSFAAHRISTTANSILGSSQMTQWVHADVPLGGVVKMSGDDLSWELVAFGANGATSSVIGEARSLF